MCWRVASLRVCTDLRRIAGLLVRVLLEFDRLSGLVGEGLDEAGEGQYGYC